MRITNSDIRTIEGVATFLEALVGQAAQNEARALRQIVKEGEYRDQRVLELRSDPNPVIQHDYRHDDEEHEVMIAFRQRQANLDEMADRLDELSPFNAYLAGWFIREMGSMIGDHGTTFESVRNVKVSGSNGTVEVTITDHEAGDTIVTFESYEANAMRHSNLYTLTKLYERLKKCLEQEGVNGHGEYPLIPHSPMAQEKVGHLMRDARRVIEQRKERLRNPDRSEPRP